MSDPVANSARAPRLAGELAGPGVLIGLALLLGALGTPAIAAPIACQLNALNMREQGRHETLQKALMPTALVEFVGYERRSCRFLHFQVQAAATTEPLGLVVSGTPEVKAFLAEPGMIVPTQEKQ